MTSLKPTAEDRAIAGERGAAAREPRPSGDGSSGLEVFAGRYRIEGTLGAGGLGIVALATDLQLGLRVALKRVDPAIARNQLAVDRLLRGMRAARALSGEHVARVLDGGIEQGVPYVVTEHLEGCNFTTYLRRHGPLGVGEAVKYLLQICEAVAEAHAAEVLHRDLKLENLFLCPGAGGEPSVKVLDFGVSVVACGLESDGPNAASGAMRSTLLYMAPEQMRSGGGIDERADIWSIGAVGHALLCGASPFEAPTEIEICSRVLSEPPAAMVAREPLGGLEEVLLRCLEKDPDARFGDVAELARALARFGGEGAESAAERVEELLRANETVRMPGLSLDGGEEWAPDTERAVPEMLLDAVDPSELEATATRSASERPTPVEDTLVSVASALPEGGARRSRMSIPEVVLVSASELRRETSEAEPRPSSGGHGEQPRGDPWFTRRVAGGAAPRVTPVVVERAPVVGDPAVAVRPARRRALALGLVAAAALLAGVAGTWVVQRRVTGAGERGPVAMRGIAVGVVREVRELPAIGRPGGGGQIAWGAPGGLATGDPVNAAGSTGTASAAGEAGSTGTASAAGEAGSTGAASSAGEAGTVGSLGAPGSTSRQTQQGLTSPAQPTGAPRVEETPAESIYDEVERERRRLEERERRRQIEQNERATRRAPAE